MKTLTTRLSSLIIILALITGNQLKAKEVSFSPDKKETLVIKIHAPLIKVLAEIFELNDQDMIILHNELEEAIDATVAYLDNKVDIILEVDTMEFMGLYEDYEAQQLEDWMFTELNHEEEVQPLEDWMFEELLSEEEETVLEDWMFDTEYFNKNVKSI